MSQLLRPDLLAYLPQHEAEVAGLAIFFGVFVSSLPAVASGRVSALPAWPRRRVRLMALSAIVFTGVFAIGGFVVHAEPQGGLPQGHWGDHRDREIQAIWLLFVAVLAVFNVTREVRFLHRR